MARTETLRSLGGFDGHFRRHPIAIWQFVRHSRNPFHQRRCAVDHSIHDADGRQGRQRPASGIASYSSRNIGSISRRRDAYAGAWCYVHARFHRSRHGRGASGTSPRSSCFPWRVSLRRIRRSSVLARLRLLPDMGDIGLIGSTKVWVVTPYRGEASRILARRGPQSDRVIVLNCFGRGGSGIVWRMLGSSPDVIMTSKEWHVAVFGERRRLRKALLAACVVSGDQIVRALPALRAEQDARDAATGRRGNQDRRTKSRRQADGLLTSCSLR